jgi:hypothetical protein
MYRETKNRETKNREANLREVQSRRPLLGPPARALTLGIAAFLFVLLAAPMAAQVIPACLLAIDPVPDTSLFGRPGGLAGVTFPGPDHYYIHSSTHLQGTRAAEKWTGTLLYRPPISTGFGGFTSAVIVDNGDPSLQACVEIDYFAEVGGAPIATTGPITIPPNGHYSEAATPLDSALGLARGVGHARVRVVPCSDGSINEGIVGASLLHTRELFNVTDPDRPLSTNGLTPGMSSMQQLQEVQDTPELWWGPIPLTQSSSTDFFNGIAPFFTVVNPDPVPANVTIDFFIWDHATNALSGPFLWRNVTLPPFGSITEFSGPHLTALGTTNPGLWNSVVSFLGTNPASNWDILYRATTSDAGHLLGDGVMMDPYGNGLQPVSQNPDVLDSDVEPIANLVLGKRFRMLSTMLFNGPEYRIISPDDSTQTGSGSLVRMIGGVANVGAANVPTSFEYFSRNGTPISTGAITLVPGQSVRIEPGAPGYPASRAFGWLRVTGCNPGNRLIGWTGQEILETAPEPHYHKAFGQAFEGINRAEPGVGFQIKDPAIGNLALIRKVAPLDHVWTALAWPGYTTFANTSVSNIGQYRYQFYLNNGFNCTTGGPGAFYAGLPWSWTSTTYEDPLVSCGGSINLMGTADHTSGEIEGIDVLGDPFDEYGIPGFAVQWFPKEPLPPFPE